MTVIEIPINLDFATGLLTRANPVCEDGATERFPPKSLILCNPTNRSASYTLNFGPPHPLKIPTLPAATLRGHLVARKVFLP
jgi:hypothetical protein